MVLLLILIPAKRRTLLLLPLAIILGSKFLPRSNLPRRQLPHDAYVWQRRWTPAVGAALARNSDIIRAWRILAAELNSHDNWWLASADESALVRNGRPAVLVIRIDGSRVRVTIPECWPRSKKWCNGGSTPVFGLLESKSIRTPASPASNFIPASLLACERGWIARFCFRLQHCQRGSPRRTRTGSLPRPMRSSCKFMRYRIRLPVCSIRGEHDTGSMIYRAGLESRFALHFRLMERGQLAERRQPARDGHYMG